METDKQREKDVEKVIHRLSYYSESHDRKHGRGKKKRPKIPTTTATTTTTKDPVHDTYNEENEEYSEEDDEDEDYDDYYASGEYYEEELEDELHGGGGLMETERSNSYDKFPNFDNTHRSYDRFNKFNQQSNFNLNNNNQFKNADSSFNEPLAPHYTHKHFSHDFNKHPNVQAPSFNSHNKKYNSFNKEVDDTKFYKQYMSIVTKPPFIRPYSAAIHHSPCPHLVLFLILSSIYAINFFL